MRSFLQRENGKWAGENWKAEFGRGVVVRRGVMVMVALHGDRVGNGSGCNNEGDDGGGDNSGGGKKV